MILLTIFAFVIFMCKLSNVSSTTWLLSNNAKTRCPHYDLHGYTNQEIRNESDIQFAYEWKEVLPQQTAENSDSLVADIDSIESSKTCKVDRLKSWPFFSMSNLYSTISEQNNQRQQTTLPPHPLRTDTWKLQVKWRTGLALSSKKSTQYIAEFCENGYMRLQEQCCDKEEEVFGCTEATSPFFIGTWSNQLSGLAVVWRLRLRNNNNEDSNDLVFHTVFHPNLFGKQPKFVDGVILRENNNDNSKRKWFRRVVGTFSGKGIGVDTISYTYKNSQQQQRPQQL